MLVHVLLDSSFLWSAHLEHRAVLIPIIKNPIKIFLLVSRLGGDDSRKVGSSVICRKRSSLSLRLAFIERIEQFQKFIADFLKSLVVRFEIFIESL